MNKRHLRSLIDINEKEFIRIIDKAIEYKKLDRNDSIPKICTNKTLAMIFKKNSTRTRVSFETAMFKLGGHAIFLTEDSSQLIRGEDISDTARVLSGMVDLIMMRTNSHEDIKRLADNSSVPIINGLCNLFHPCQLLADMQTIVENKNNDFSKLTIAWIGDGNNMCNSYINAAKQFDFELTICCPSEYKPDGTLLEKNKERVQLISDPNHAIANADLVVTDVWASMGQEHEAENRRRKFQKYQMNKSLLSYASSDVLYLHCLPAHRGEEISAELLDAPDTVIWEAAENRLHSQKALMEMLLGI